MHNRPSSDKLLSVVVPCYNSQDYMKKAIESLLSGGNETEILIVDDGSTDDTARIADDFAANYPDIVRTIHKENGGHGDAVMAGLEHAKGLYFKVVDSDDWLDPQAYHKVLSALRSLTDDPVDLLISNFIYDKEGKKKKYTMDFSGVLPEGRVFGWKDVKHFHWGQYIMMHCVIYRTQLLRDSGMKLPKHTFYVDNLYVYQPLKCVSRMYYMNVDLYHYYIGREDQSIQENVIIRRLDQMLHMNRLMILSVDPYEMNDSSLTKYMIHYLEIIIAVTSTMLFVEGSKDSKRREKRLWEFIKKNNPRVYRRLRRSVIGHILHLPGRPGRRIIIFGYHTCQRFFGFN